MKSLYLLLPFVLFLTSCPNEQTGVQPVNNSEINYIKEREPEAISLTSVITAPIVRKSAIDKRGSVLDFKEYYIQKSIQDYFIKFCESDISLNDFEHALENIYSPIKVLTLKVEFREGEWDKCDDYPVQSRIGKYVIIKKIIEND